MNFHACIKGEQAHVTTAAACCMNFSLICLPSWMGFKLVQYSMITIFEDKMELALSPEHLQQVDKVSMLELL